MTDNITSVKTFDKSNLKKKIKATVKKDTMILSKRSINAKLSLVK